MELIVKKSLNRGKGVFTKTFIPKRQTIFKLFGERISLREVNKRIAEGTLPIDDPLQIGEEEFIVVEKTISHFFNHSCDPNAGIKRESELFALRDIESGEEVTFDYSTTEHSGIPWVMKCICGVTNCRTRIGDIASIPRDQFLKYKELSAFPDYLKKYIEHA